MQIALWLHKKDLRFKSKFRTFTFIRHIIHCSAKVSAVLNISPAKYRIQQIYALRFHRIFYWGCFFFIEFEVLMKKHVDIIIGIPSKGHKSLHTKFQSLTTSFRPRGNCLKIYYIFNMHQWKSACTCFLDCWSQIWSQICIIFSNKILTSWETSVFLQILFKKI